MPEEDRADPGVSNALLFAVTDPASETLLDDEQKDRCCRIISRAERYGVDFRAVARRYLDVTGASESQHAEQSVRNLVRTLRERDGLTRVLDVMPVLEEAIDAAREHQECLEAERTAAKHAKEQARAAAKAAKAAKAVSFDSCLAPLEPAQVLLKDLQDEVLGRVEKTQTRLREAYNQIRRKLKEFEESHDVSGLEKELQEAEAARDAAEATAEAASAAAAAAESALNDAREELAEYEKLFADSIRMNKLTNLLLELVPKLQEHLSHEGYVKLAAGIAESRLLIDAAATTIKESSNA
jgi:hypothetical protein